MSGYPELRLRRLRRTEGLRSLFRQTSLSAGDFIYPIFVTEGDGGPLLFGIPSGKDECGSSGLETDAIVLRAIRAIKDRVPDTTVITDVCLCEYTSCGNIRRTLAVIRQAISSVREHRAGV